MVATAGTVSRRRLLQVSGAVAAAAGLGPMLGGCGSGGSGGTTGSLRFAFWGADDRVKRFRKALGLFTEQHSGLTIAPEFGEIGSVETKLTVAMAGQNLPDVFWIGGNPLAQYASEGHLVLLDEHLGSDGAVSADGFTDPVMEPGQVDGRQYAMTHGLQSVGMFARKDVLDDVGVPVKSYPDAYTWEEFADYCTEIGRAKGGKFYGTDEPSYAGAPNFFRAFVRQNGQELWNDDGDLGFSRELLTEWLEYWKRLRDTGAAVPPDLALEQNPFFEGAPMIRGLSAFHLRNSNQLLELSELTDNPLVLMPVPGNGGAGNENIALDPNLVGIAKNTKNQEAALTFLDFLLNDEERARIIGTTIGGPPTQRMRDAIRPTLSEAEAPFLDYISFEAEAKSKPVPQAPATGSAFQDGMTKAIETHAYGKTSVKEVVDTVFGELRKKLTS